MGFPFDPVGTDLTLSLRKTLPRTVPINTNFGCRSFDPDFADFDLAFDFDLDVVPDFDLGLVDSGFFWL